MRYKQLILLGAVVGCVRMAQSATYTWVGTSDAYWTNAANWRVNGEPTMTPPGKYLVSDGGVISTNGVAGDVVVMGALGEGAATTINLDGINSIKGIQITGAAAPTYNIGVSASPMLPFENGGGITVGSDVVNPQNIKAKIYCTGLSHTYTHNGKGLLDFAGGFTNTIKEYYFGGTGDYAFSANYPSESYSHFKGSGTIYLRHPSNNTTQFKLIYSDSCSDNSSLVRHFVVPKGCRVDTCDGSNPSTSVNVSQDTLIDGEGTYYANVWNHGIAFTVNAGKTLTMRVGKLTCNDINEKRAFFTLINNGTIQLESPCDRYHLQHVIRNEGTISTDLIGTNGCPYTESHIGYGEVSVGFQSNGTFAYTGTGETTDRTLTLRNTDKPIVPTLCNNGTGTLTWAGEITQTNSLAGNGFVLKANTAPIDFTGSFDGLAPFVLTIAGNAGVTVAKTQEKVSALKVSGTFTLGGYNKFPNAETITLDGGTIEVPAANGELTNLVVTAANGKLNVPAGATVKIATLDVDNGELSITSGEGATVSIEKETAGVNIGNVHYNGYPAKFGSDGKTLEADVTSWHTAQDGNWNEAEKWSNGLPIRDEIAEADIVVNGDYTVSITEDVAGMPRQLTVGTGNAEHVATLKQNENVSVVMGNSRVNVNAGGVYSLTNAALLITNTASGNGSFTLAEGSLLKAEGHSLVQFATYAGDFRQVGGDMLFTGNATNYIAQNQFTFGTGHVIFTNSAAFRMKVNSTCSLKPNAAGETCELTIDSDKALLNYAEQCSLLINHDVKGGRSVYSVGHDGWTDWTQSLFSYPFYTTIVGYRNGYGEYNVRRGKCNHGNNGLSVGGAGHTYEPSVGDNLAPTGVVNVAGGLLYVGAWGNPYQYYLLGLMIGNGSRDKPNSGNFFRGTLNLKNGSIEVTPGYIVVGAGPASGDLNQSGGQIKFDSSDKYRYEFIVGLAGGKGEYNLSAGKAYIYNRFWVGGMPIEEINAVRKNGNSNLVDTNYYPKDKLSAIGTLDMSGGLFSSTTNVYVGADGSGTLKFSGKANFTCRTLVLSNQVESTLAFELPSTTIPAWTVSASSVTITDGAKLIVDARNCQKPFGKTVKLFGSTTPVEGEFAAANITVTSDDKLITASECEFTYESGGEYGLWLKFPNKGMLLILK